MTQTQLISLVVPNTDVVLITEKRHVTKIGGTKEAPLVWIKGINRAFQPANRNTVKQTENPQMTEIVEHLPQETI